MRLFLVRHAQTHSNAGRALDTAYPGAALTDLGLAQAARLGVMPGGTNGHEFLAAFDESVRVLGDGRLELAAGRLARRGVGRFGVPTGSP